MERTRKSLVEEGVESAMNRQSPCIKRKRIIEGEEEVYLIALVCGPPPDGHCSWSLVLLADRTYVPAVSHETLREALKKMSSSLSKKRSGAFHQNPIQPSSVKWKKSSTSIKPRRIQNDQSYASTNLASN